MRRPGPDMLLVPAPCDTSGWPTVAIPNGYQMQPRIPLVTLNPILLSPSAMVPFGGTI